MNATLIQPLHAFARGDLSLLAGLVVLAGLSAWLFLEAARAGWRLKAERGQSRATLEKLRAQTAEVRLRCRQAGEAQAGWNGIRKFSVAKKTVECEDVCAFYLKPHDGRPIPAFKPGQYLTFHLELPGRDKTLIRCYSLSDSPRDYYRVTIKKEKAPADRPDLPPGAASSYFCDAVKEGDILNVKAPGGHFFLDMAQSRAVVLIGGGVGVTPMLSMANAIAASGSKREAWFFLGVRNRRDHIHKAELEKLAAENENIRLHVCYSKPGEGDVKGRDFQHEGRVTVELFKELLPSSNFSYYLCGPGAFMKSITEGLEEWGVPEGDVHFEAFGPATVKKKAVAPSAEETVHLARINVTFGRLGKTVRWEPSAGNLLDFARDNGVKIDSGCCAGGCGTCLVAIKSGEVTYLQKPDAEPEAGACLTCICRPKSHL
ncbi:MAG: 2Fe-2S iron-sulfur cluster binding domain-containing protein, partial [Verrucomicrobia bacterium]|nr:2Fe-2S iron-sulfur cluster binding domain-containing protein [Verrucomicrobiota bacterium]